MVEMLRKVGGNFNPDFGEREAMSFDDANNLQTKNTLHFISDMVLNTKKNEKVSTMMQRIRVKKIIVESLCTHHSKAMILKNKNILQAYVNERLIEMIDNKSHLPMVLEQRGDRFQSQSKEKEFWVPKEIIGPLFDNEEFLDEIKKELRKTLVFKKHSGMDLMAGLDLKWELNQLEEWKQIMDNIHETQKINMIHLNTFKGNQIQGLK